MQSQLDGPCRPLHFPAWAYDDVRPPIVLLACALICLLQVVKALPAHGLDTPCVLLSTSPGIVSSLYRSHAGAAGAIGSPAGQHDPAAAALVSWQVPVKEEVWLLEPAAHPKATAPATSTANSVNGQEFLPGSAPLSAAAAAAAAAALPPTSAPGAAAGSGLLTFSNGASSALKSPDSLLLRGAAAGHAGPSAAGSAAALASAEEDGDYEDDYGLACDAATDPIRSKLGSASTVANSTVSGENAHSPSTTVKPYTKPHDSASKPGRVSEQGAERLGATQVREGDNVTGRQGSHGPSRAGTAMAKPENHSAVGGSRTAPSTVRPVFAMQTGSSAAALPAAISSRVSMCASSLAGGTAAPAAAAPVPAQKTTRQRSDSGEDKGGMAGGTYPLAERKRNEAKGVLQGMPLWVVWGAAALSVMAAEMVLSLQHAGL